MKECQGGNTLIKRKYEMKKALLKMETEKGEMKERTLEGN